jgi:ABC-type Na+ transport system ATPase subunit NatA
MRQADREQARGGDGESALAALKISLATTNHRGHRSPRVRAEYRDGSRFGYDVCNLYLESGCVSETTAAIAIHDLEKIYRHGLFGRKKIPALKGVSLEVPPGEVFGLLGPNGAGKTTLIKVLLGIVRKSSGSATLRPAEIARRQVGYLPEHHRIPHHLTGDTALEYYGSLSGMSQSEIRRRRPDLLKRVGLATWGKTPVKKYSKGMLQRLGLAQAMIHDPQLLILDEPTDGVDPVGRAEIRDVLSELRRQGKTVFLNSHLLQEVELVCDRSRHSRPRADARVGPSTRSQPSGIEASPCCGRMNQRALVRRVSRSVRVAGCPTMRVSAARRGETLDRATDALRAASALLR